MRVRAFSMHCATYDTAEDKTEIIFKIVCLFLTHEFIRVVVKKQLFEL